MAQLGDVTIRRAGSEDATAIAGLHADSWRRHYRGAYSDAFLDGDVGADRLEVWTQRLAAPGATTTTLLAEDDGAFVGFVHVAFDEDPRWGSLVDNLHVVWTRKRDGIGTRLMSAAASAVVERGSGGLYLWVLEQNTAAQGFYAARGGVCAGRRLVPAPGGVAEWLGGSPVGLLYAWPDPGVLIL